MGTWLWIKDVVVKVFWPWFLEAVWPAIKKHAAQLILLGLDMLASAIKRLMINRTKTRSDEANQQAAEYEKKAEVAENEIEAENYKKIAQIWREVAEKYRQDNEFLKNKMEELVADVKLDVLEKVDALKINLHFKDKVPELTMDDQSYELKELPYNEFEPPKEGEKS